MIPYAIGYTDGKDIIKENYNFPFPNPSEDYVNLETDLTGNASVEVYNIFGTKLNVDFTLQKSEKEKDIFKLDVSALPIGAYFYTISNGQKIFRGRFVKK